MARSQNGPDTRWQGRIAAARAIAVAAVALAMAGCVTTSARQNYTFVEMASARVGGQDGLRFVPDSQPDIMAALGWADPSSLPEMTDGKLDVLALSSGGPDGAYGAGALKGLVEAGTLPNYETVTGVSTGALIAPLIFAGPQYLPQIERIYTDGSLGRLVGPPNLFTALGGASIYPATQIPAFIDKVVDRQLLANIAAQHATGRRLLVATANLDANRLVVWDMGRIASLGTPQSADLFRRVLRAAIAIPAALPPVEIESVENGRTIRELHGDAGVVAYFYGDESLVPAHLRSRRGSQRARLDVILHNQIEGRTEPVEARTIELAGRSVSSLTRTSMRLLLDDTIRRTKENGVAMRYAYVPTEWETVTSLDFDSDYMRRTFDLGYRKAVEGTFWHAGPRR